jgi:hypothetical protein
MARLCGKSWFGGNKPLGHYVQEARRAFDADAMLYSLLAAGFGFGTQAHCRTEFTECFE